MKASTAMRRKSHPLREFLKSTYRIENASRAARRRGRSYFLKLFSSVFPVERPHDQPANETPEVFKPMITLEDLMSNSNRAKSHYDQLVNATLEVLRYDSNYADMSLIKRQIMLAMCSCNLRLVEVFLRGGASSVTWRRRPTSRCGTDPMECTDYDRWLSLIPAIVHACGHRELKKQGSLEDSMMLSSRRSRSSDCFNICTPLQKTIKVALACLNEGIACPLPALTRLIIDAGGSLNGLGKNRFTAVHTLLLGARHLFSSTDSKHIIDTDNTIIDTARTLIKARIVRDPFEDGVSFDIVFNAVTLLESSHLRSASLDFLLQQINLNVFPLYSKLTELFATHQTYNIVETADKDHYKDLFSCVVRFLETKHLVRHLPLNKYNDIMDSVANMFRCRLLAGADLHVTDFFSPFTSDPKSFVEKFSCVAGHSAQPGRSNKFLRLLLDDALSLTDVEKLERLLTARVKELNEMTEEEYNSEMFLTFPSIYQELQTLDTVRTFTCDALEAVRSVVKPRRLQNLLRAAIVKAVVPGTIRGVASLNLPEEVKQYVLLNNY